MFRKRQARDADGGLGWSWPSAVFPSRFCDVRGIVTSDFAPLPLGACGAPIDPKWGARGSDLDERQCHRCRVERRQKI